MTKNKIFPLLIIIAIILVGLFCVTKLDWFLNYFNFDIEVHQLFSLWFPFSVIVIILWAFMMEDPGSNGIVDIIITIICGLLAAPLTLIIIFIFCTILLINKTNETIK